MVAMKTKVKTLAEFDPRLFIFDLDGTIIEFHHDYLFSQTEQILPALGHAPVPRDTLEECFSAFDFFRFVADEMRDQFIAHFWANFDWEGFPAPRLIPGAYQAVERITAAGIPVSIATSRFMEVSQLKSDLSPTGILPFISHVVSRNSDHIHWTDKRGLITEVCNLHQVDPKDAVMVGDIPTDVTSAHDCGIGLTVAVLSGGVREEVLLQAKPDIIVNDINALSNLINPKQRAKF